MFLSALALVAVSIVPAPRELVQHAGFCSSGTPVRTVHDATIPAEAEISEYVKYTKMIMKSPGVFGGVLVMSIISNILIAFVPYFVLATFGGNVGFISCFVLTIAVESAVYFIPTPGNSGAAEGTFYIVFSALSTGYVFWAMLFWRLYSYYVFQLQLSFADIL